MITRLGMQIGSEVVHLVRLLDQYDHLVTELLSRMTIPTHIDMEEGLHLPQTLQFVDKIIIERYLGATRWNVAQAARLLHLDRISLYHRMQRYKLERPRGS